MNNLFEQLSRERKDLQAKGYYPSWFTTQGHQMFKDKYMYEDTYLLGRHKTIAKTLAKYLPTSIQDHYEQVFFDLLWSGKLSAATPVLANCGTDRGLTVSCSGQYIGDDVDSFYSNLRETALLTKYGFGTSGGFSTIRPRGAAISKGGTANGVRPVIDDFFIATNKISQGSSRRGSFAAYLDIEHDDFDECLQDLFINTDGKNYGWVIKDSFINKLQAGDEEANRRFKEIIYLKLIHGKGYFFFVDRANRHRPEMYKEHGLDIKASNLCSEVILHSGPDYTYSCILSSINLTHWDEIENDNTIFDATIFLDCVTSDFIHNASTIPGLERVVEFTKKGRAIGLGVMGLHSLLQSKSIPMDSMEAHLLDGTIFKRLHNESLRASQCLAAMQGEPDWCKGYGVRNTHRCVTGDTEVITKQGSKPIKSLVGQTLEIWNGYEWSVMTPFITSESEEVYKVTLSNGKEVICTPDHKWAVKNNRHRKPISVETIDLKEGDKLNKWDYPTLEGDKELSHPYTSGFFSGDGSYSQSKPQYPNCKQRKEIRICPKSGKEVCLDYLSVKDGCTVRDSNGGYRFYIPDEVSEKFFVPNEDYTVNSRLKWLAGLLDADGSNAGAFTTINLEFAKKVVHLANVTGLYASLTTEKPARISEIEGRTINCKPLYKVGFSRKQLVESYDKGLTIRRLDFGKPNRESIDYVSVISVEKKGNSKTYCVTDKLRGTCMFNGITTLQCAQAPTKSTALLMGGVSEGISPDPGMAFEASSAVGELTRITPVFYQLMKERGMYSEKTVNRIIENLGSVQQEDWLTDHEKEVFKTAFEVSQEMLINRTAARQKYFCQGQSLNLFVPGDGDGVEERIAQLISQVFVNENILSQYYIYSRNGVVVNDDCVACSA